MEGLRSDGGRGNAVGGQTMTPQRINELLSILSKADFVWIGARRMEYSMVEPGIYEPDHEVYDDLGSIEVKELQELLCKYKDELR